MEKKYKAHEKALVDEGAKIGEGTRVWAFAHVLSGAEIGKNCNIGDFSMVESGARLGDDCTVKNGVQVWEGVIAEDGVFFGPNCVFTNDMVPRSFRKRPKEEWLEKTYLKKGCSIGANATIVCGNTIGRYAFVAAGSVVAKDVADFALVKGVPAKFHAWICKCGAKLAFKGTKAACKACGAKYAKAKSEIREA